MEDTSLTGVYGPKEIQSTSKKYIDGQISISNDSNIFTNVAEIPLIIKTLTHNVQKNMTTLGFKNPKEQNKYRRNAENCCRLIENFIAATLYGGLDQYPSTKFMVYMMANQFLDRNGTQSTITIDAFKNLYLDQSTSSSTSPLYDFKLPEDYADIQLQFMTGEEVTTKKMSTIQSKEICEEYTEENKTNELNLELQQYFNDFADANSYLYTQLSNINTQKLVGVVPYSDGILLLQKLLIKVSSNKTAGNIGGPFALRLKMDNILNNLVQFNIKARINILRHLFVYSSHNNLNSLLTINLLNLINKAFPNLSEDNMLKSAHKLADLNNNMNMVSLEQIDSLFSIIEDDVKQFKDTNSFQISKTDGSKTDGSNSKGSNKQKIEKKKPVLDKPCQACTYFEVITGKAVQDAPHHAMECPNFTSKMINKIWHYEIKNGELKTENPEMPEKFNLKEMNSNSDYKSKFASLPKLTAEQLPKTKKNQK